MAQKVSTEEYIWNDIEEENVYSREARELLVENEALRAEEEAFMEGYDEGDLFNEQEDDFAEVWEEEMAV